ncbi:MAG TPA: triose-phosphate isomerase [Casimicrobiaceae bacterium]|nr:triose-phosphate isomerase [Casimicrobiaceae bacterium]
MRGRVIVGNWKMNGGIAANEKLIAALLPGWRAMADRKLAVCVPFPYLAQMQQMLNGTSIAWGSQDISGHASGAYTGEVSGPMLAEFGCTYALAGHSERRRYHRESDAEVAAKARAALNASITPIVCVGETLDERDAGETTKVVSRQFDAVVRVIESRIGDTVIAYEPVWAIGTGRTASPAQAQEVHGVLRERLKRSGAENVPILYGGSVKAANAAALMAMQDVDGALVGGASLDADELLAIALAD